jgi:hypothetical protein
MTSRAERNQDQLLPSLPSQGEMKSRPRSSALRRSLPKWMSKVLYSLLPRKLCSRLFVTGLTNETLLPPFSHCLRQTGLGRAVCSLSCTSGVRSRVMAGLLRLLHVVSCWREAYFLSPPSMPPTMGKLLSLLLPESLPFFLSSPPRPKAPRSLLTPRPPSRPLTRPPRPRPLSS